MCVCGGGAGGSGARQWGPCLRCARAVHVCMPRLRESACRNGNCLHPNMHACIKQGPDGPQVLTSISAVAAGPATAFRVIAGSCGVCACCHCHSACITHANANTRTVHTRMHLGRLHATRRSARQAQAWQCLLTVLGPNPYTHLATPSPQLPASANLTHTYTCGHACTHPQLRAHARDERVHLLHTPYRTATAARQQRRRHRTHSHANAHACCTHGSPGATRCSTAATARGRKSSTGRAATGCTFSAPASPSRCCRAAAGMRGRQRQE